MTPPRLLIVCFAAISLTTATLVSADRPALVITSAGYQYLDTGEDGLALLVPVSRIIDLRGGGDTDGPSPPAPDPDTPNLELTRLAKGWANEIDDPQTAQAMALVYLQIADSVKAGDLTLESGPMALSLATDAVLASIGKADQWRPFRKNASDELTRQRQRGTVNSSDSLEAFLRAVANGLELSADGSDAVAHTDLLQVVVTVNRAIDEAR